MEAAIRPKALAAGLLVAAATCAGAMLLVAAYRSGGMTSRQLQWVIAYFLGGLATAIVLGLPALFVLRRFGLARWWSALLAGGAFGAAFACALRQTPVSILLMTCVGVVSALAFWFTCKSARNA